MPSDRRPRIHLARTVWDLVLDGAAAALWLAGIAIAGAAYADLPDRIPVHFDLEGTPNRWGTRWELFGPSAIALALFVGSVVLTRFPHAFNYTVDIDAENAPRQYRLAVRLLRSLNVLIQALFSCIVWVMVRASQGLSHMAMWLVPVIVAGTFALLIVYLIQAHAVPSSRRSA